MFPPFFAALPADIDATATMTATMSAIVGTSGDARYAMTLASAEGSLWARILRPGNVFVVDVFGRYGRALATTGTTAPPTDLATRARVRFDSAVSPRTHFLFITNGFVSSRIGLRASDDLVVRDPFSTNRVLYGFGAQPSWLAVASPLTSLRFDLQYTQAGAIAADVPEAVGVDTHMVTASAAATTRLTPRLALGPVGRISFTHFYRALLDVNLTRGPADVASASVLGSLRYDPSPRTRARAVLGLTVASPPPQIKNASTVVSPDARFELSSLGPRLGGTAGVAIGYRSLGPRIGFGMDYAAFVDGWTRPLHGSRYRDVLAHVVARIRRANAPLAATPMINFGQAVDPPSGQLTTTAFAFGTALSFPVRLGFTLSAGIDLEYVAAGIDPVPKVGELPEMFRGLFTIGLTAIGSTDPERRLPRDPLQVPNDPRSAATRRATRPGVSASQLEDVEDFWDEDAE